MTGLRIAFQGVRGAYSEEATRGLFGADVEPIPSPSFRAVFEEVAAGKVDGGVVPVENSLAGSVAENVDLLLEFSLPATGELSLRIRHCLLAPAGTSLREIQRAISHPQALTQCGKFLRQHGIFPVVSTDTAGGAKRVAEEAPPYTAAIASRAAADIYGLTVLQEGIEDSPDNHTRFLSLGAVPPLTSTRSKTALAFTVAYHAGTLHKVLGVFASRGINFTRLESRPMRRPWEYVFCLDLEGAHEDPAVAAALEEATRLCTSFRVLGSYRVAD